MTWTRLRPNVRDGERITGDSDKLSHCLRVGQQIGQAEGVLEKTQKSGDRYKLTSEEVCAVFEVESFKFENTEKLDPLEGVIGQDRAVHAIEFGLGMSSFGYNIYAAGIPGTGRNHSLDLSSNG